MVNANRNFRSGLLLSTAVAAMIALPGAAHAQLVNAGELNSAIDSGGNGGQLTVVDTSATQTDMTVLAPVVIANWDSFNVPTGTTVNIAPDTGLTSASLINRVTGPASNISGTINAPNINLWLLNQNGIIFGGDASISSASFLATTLGATDSDLFDFFEGTDLAGNGSQTVRFSGLAANTSPISGGGMNASFVSDGSLAFIGPRLDLNATFDAGGSVSFVAAADVSVQFTPNSPLSYTVNAGTIVAEQIIDGSITGRSVDFRMLTASGVMDAMLRVDATINATTAVATDSGVRLIAEQIGMAETVTVEMTGGIISTGLIELRNDGDLSSTQAMTGSGVFVRGEDLVLNDVTATAGGVRLEARQSLLASDVGATGEISFEARFTASATFDSLVSSGGRVTNFGLIPNSTTVTGLTQGTEVDLKASNLSLGDVTATTGSVSLDSFNSPLTVGNIDAATAVELFGLSVMAGDVIARSGLLNIDIIGEITTGSLTSLNGAIAVESFFSGDVEVGALDASGTIRLDATGSLTAAAITAGGALTVGSVETPTNVTFTGNVSAASITAETSGAIGAQGLTATAGDIDLDAASINAGALAATGGDVVLLTTGNITTASITSTTSAMAGGAIDVGSTGAGTLNLGEIGASGAVELDTTGTITTAAITAGGALTVGAVGEPSSVTFNGNVSAGSVTIDVTGAFSVFDLEATAGGIDIDAASITATPGGNLSATGGDVILLTSGAILTNSITATRAGGVGGSVDVTSTASGLALGDVTATGGDVDLLADATISALSITATAVGGIGGAITVESTGDNMLDLGDLDASGAISLETADVVNYASITAGGALTVGATGAVASFSGGNISAASVTVDTLGTANMGAVTATAGTIDVDANEITATSFSATGGDVLLLMNGQLFGGPAITANQAGMVGGAISVVSTGSGNLTLGTLDADGAITLDTGGAISGFSSITAGGALTIGGVTEPSQITLFGAVNAGSITIDTIGNVLSLSGGLAATAGGVAIDAGGISISGLVSATGGDVDLTSASDLFTGGISATQVAGIGGAIDVESTSGAGLVLGQLGASGGITLDTAGTISTAAITAGGALEVGQSLVPASVTFTGNASAASITIDTSGAVVAQGLTATAGGVDIDADSILSGTVRATGGNVLLVADGAITTGTVIATTVAGTGGAITIDSTAGGALDLGALSASRDIALDTTGSVTTLDIVSTGGQLAIGDLRSPLGDIALGEVGATNVFVNGNAAFVAEAVTATAGRVLIDAGSIDTLGIRATGGEVDLIAEGDITTGAINATLDIDVDSNNSGDVSLGSLQAGLGITLDTGGALRTGAVTATAGSLRVGDDNTPSSVTFGGNVSAQSINVVSTGEVLAGARNMMGAVVARNNMTATSGSIFIDAGAITAGIVSATRGDVGLLSSGDVLTGNITALRSGGVGGAIDVESLGGALDLGALSADLGIALDADGTISAAGATARGGALTVGTGSSPDGVTFTGDATGQSVSIITPGDVNGLALTATAGDVTVGANAMAVGAVSATGNVELTATRGVQTGDIDADGTITVTSTGTGATAGALVLGDVDAGQAVALSAGGAITAGVVNSDTSSVTITSGAQIGTGAVNAGGGNATLSAPGNVGTGAITASGAISAVSTGTAGGDLDLGNLMASLGITLDADGDIEIGSITATGGALQVGLASAADSVTIGGPASARSIGLRSTGAVEGVNMTATAGNLTINAGTSIDAGTLAATGGNVLLTAAGDIRTGELTAILAPIGGGTIDVESTGGAIDLGGLTADLGIDLDALGAVLVTGGMTARSGSITADGRSIRIIGAGTATRGDIRLTAIGSILTDALTATRASNVGGAIDIESTGTGMNAGVLGLGALLADLGIELDARGSITTGALTARNGAVDVEGASITVSGATAATGGNVRLLASGAISTGTINAARAAGVGGAIDIDSTDGGAIDLGAAAATEGITLDTLGTVTAAGLDAGTASNVVVGADRRASAVTFTGEARAANITVNTGGLFTADLMNVNTGVIRVSAGDVELTRSVRAGTLTITSTVASTNAGTPQVGLGTATGVMSLSDAELDRINATNLLIDGGAGEVRIAGVSFTDDAGRSNVDIATTGLIGITGDVSGTGSARTFRLGGTAEGTGTASRITANIDTATIDFGTSTLALRGTSIVFGQQALIDVVDGMSLDDQVKELIGNATSLLYTPFGLGPARLANPTYLAAGRLSVTYGGSALFQNSAPPGSASAFEGVRLGGMGAAPGAPLQLNPLVAPNVVGSDVVDGNVFALFGSINGATGPAASLGGSSVIEVNGNILVPASRINGCIIGSAEGCITTIVGNFVLIVPRELISPIVAEEGVPLPFDPLVGTNNESLFSDAASAPENDEACRERNAAGVCVGN